MTFHDLRRVFLNRVCESGVPMDVAMRLSGHEDVDVVLRYYREIPQAAADAAMAGLFPEPE